VAKFDGGFTAPQPMPALAISDRARGGCLDEWSECAEWVGIGV
jgi:prolyl 4-hydroxylase